jgi:concanavalin A-like lectin/glucanase superfamily protein
MKNKPFEKVSKTMNKKNKEERNKRAMSTIIATLIIIALALVAGILIWFSVSKLIHEGKDQIELSKVTLNLEIKKALAMNDSFVKVHVKRNPGKGELSGLSFVFNNGFKSEVIERNLTLEELQEDVFIIALGEVNVNEVKSISIAPILELKSGKDVTGDIQDEFKIGLKGLTCEATCELFGKECGTEIYCGEFVDCGSCPLGFSCPDLICIANTYAWEEDLISWWNFSGNADDYRGNNPGIVNGATLETSGCKKGTCYDFDGVDDYIDLGTFSISGNELTLSAWTRYEGDEYGLDPVVISKAHGTAPGDHIFLMGINDTAINRANFLFGLRSGGESENYNTGIYNLNHGWHQFVYVYNSSHMLVYYDAYLISMTPKTGNLEINSDPVNIGRNPINDSDGYRYWDGKLDEIMVWERAITGAEITEIYNLFE